LKTGVEPPHEASVARFIDPVVLVPAEVASGVPGPLPNCVEPIFPSVELQPTESTRYRIDVLTTPPCGSLLVAEKLMVESEPTRLMRVPPTVRVAMLPPAPLRVTLSGGVISGVNITVTASGPFMVMVQELPEALSQLLQLGVAPAFPAAVRVFETPSALFIWHVCVQECPDSSVTVPVPEPAIPAVLVKLIVKTGLS